MLPAEDLIADVAAAEGLEAALDPASVDGLERLLWSMANEADLNEIGNLADCQSANSCDMAACSSQQDAVNNACGGGGADAGM